MSWQEAGKKKRVSSNVIKSWDVENDSGSVIISLHDIETDAQLEAMDSNGDDGTEEMPSAPFPPEIMEQAYQEGFNIGSEAGYDEGYRKGYHQGEKAGLASVEKLHKQALSLLQEIERFRREEITNLEPGIIKLAVNIAEKILFSQLTLDQDMMNQIAKRSIEALAAPRYINIRMNPGEGEVLSSHIDELRESLTADILLKIIKDPQLTSGSCVLETDQGVLNASVDVQLGEVKKVLGID